MRWAWHAAYMGERRDSYTLFVRKPDGKRPFTRPRHRWEDDMRMGVREIGWEGVDCMYLAQDKDQ
jgi:hypothetical protein